MQVLKQFQAAGFLYPQNVHHGVEHHVQVLSIFLELYPDHSKCWSEKEWALARDLIAIHDGLDHKYPELHKHNTELLIKMGRKDLVEMAGKISWSKRQLYPDLCAPAKIARYCDWITALDLERTLEFSRENNPTLGEKEINELAVAHANEKLLLIHAQLPEPFHSYAVPWQAKLERDVEKLK